MTITDGTGNLNQIYDKYAHHFQKGFPSFHNLLWQLIVNRAREDKIIAFTAVIDENGTTMAYVGFNEPGYYSTGVYFVEGTDYDTATAIAYELNVRLFGITEGLSEHLVMLSMRKDETATH